MRRMYSEKQLEKQTIDLLDSGNVPSIKADSIIENMKGFSFEKQNSLSWTPKYVGVCKNGNKITFVVFGTLNFTSGTPNAGAFGNFIIPEEIGKKLIPYPMGDTTNILMQKYNDFFNVGNSALAPKNAIIDISKVNNTKINVNGRLLQDATFVANNSYVFRFEATFLLSDSLVS